MLNTLSNWLIKLRNCHFLGMDAIGLIITPLLALSIRLDSSFTLAPYASGLLEATILFLVVKLSVLYTCGFYRHYWRYASIDELVQIAVLIASACVLQTFLFNVFYYLTDFSINSLPRSLPLLDSILSFLLVGGVRFSVRAFERFNQRYRKFDQLKNVLIVGAGNAGISLVEEMQRNPQLGFHPVAFIDDNPEKLNLRIRQLPVVGSRERIPKFVHSLDVHKVIVAMPSAPGRVIREIVDICQLIGVPTNTLPEINEILNSGVSIGSIRDIQIEDLLRREPIYTDRKKVCQLIAGKKVLITGAGGSIGSELCRQVLKCHPAEILLLGHGENSIFNIQKEMERFCHTLTKTDELQSKIRITTFIGDIRFLWRVEHAFAEFQPDIVFHAAAHKHVPMMELNAPEAITNNVQGTKNLVDLALRYNVQHFVMISTDKAVNPTNVMGASKRVAEMVVLQAAQKSGKPFVVVRFGNVLGSRGSVVPIFKQQIAEGGPITITHPEICRYFMTIPEAVQLVLQAAIIGHGGEVLMLDMGEPVKIVDLAKDLIRLSGYEVGKDIEITFTGLRPGEKLYEELFIPGEKYDRTEHEKIIRVRNASHIIKENIDYKIASLLKAANENNSHIILYFLEQIVPEYVPQKSTTDLYTSSFKYKSGRFF